MNWLDKFADMFQKPPRLEEFKGYHKTSLKKYRILIPFKFFPLQLELGTKNGAKLDIYPDQALDSGNSSKVSRYIIFDSVRYVDEIYAFLSLEQGEKLLLGRDDMEQQQLFNYGTKVKNRHLIIGYDEGGIIFHKVDNEAEVVIKRLKKKKAVRRLYHHRVTRLGKIKKLFGGSIEPLSSTQALDALKRVNALSVGKDLRPLDKNGKPGGVITVQGQLVPIIIGDLHAQIDNLLKILVENNFLDMLEKGRACLLILGDAVHSEEEDKLADMDDSLLMMDLIVKLKLHFPDRFFYLRGNHDSFSEDISKGGVPQGILWKKAVLTQRGEAYFKALKEFYAGLPYLAFGKDFTACHAGPPGGKVSLEQLVNIRAKPRLEKALVCSRLKRPGYPAGYTKGDIKDFRKSLKLKKDACFIVSHNPLSEDKAVWLNVGEIPGHHIVFSGKNHSIGVFTRINGVIRHLIYPTESLRKIIRSL